jgi:osmotically-inducible protein OsmY
VLAAAIALVLAGPAYASDPAPTTRDAAADRATVSVTKPADNSAHNERDAAGNKVTPLDQSHAETDVEMTRSIRKMLVDDDSLGTNAQNVKVITVDGKVTLRGPVANANEQARVVAIAKKAAGADRVVSELQVITR